MALHAENKSRRGIKMFIKPMELDDASVDPVVQEVDVFLTKSLKKLYLLQHHVRPKHAAPDEANLNRARIKPIQQMIELEFELNSRDSTYDLGRGEHIARTVDGGCKHDEKYFNSHVMDRQVKQTVKALPCSTRYVVGCFVNGDIHVTPLHSIVKLHPTFDYLDRSDTKQREENRLDNDEAPSDEEELTQRVTVKFANADKEKAKKMSDKSFIRHQQILDDEPWIDVVFNKNESETAEYERKKLIYNRGTDRGPTDSLADPDDYAQLLIPKEADVERTLQSSSAPETLSLAQQSALPLGDQIHALLKSAKVITFSELLSLLSSNTDSEAVLRLVQEVAVLVQGCWVIKSDRLYPKDVRSGHSGVSNEILVRGRDYVLWKFTRNRFVTRKEMAVATKLPSDDLKEILENLALRRSTLEWEFLLATDLAFLEKYTQVAERQQKLWDVRSKKLQGMLKENKTADAKPARTKSQQADDRVATATAAATTTTGSEELVSFVGEKLAQHRCVSLSDLKRFLSNKLASSPPGHVLGRGISDKLLAQAAECAGARVLDVKWQNDCQQESVFALVSKGDRLDPARTALLEMFKTNSKYRKKNIHKKIEEETKTTLADAESAELLFDYCVNRNGWYYLKGVAPPNEKGKK